jgi:hypothetical protein
MPVLNGLIRNGRGSWWDGKIHGGVAESMTDAPVANGQINSSSTIPKLKTSALDLYALLESCSGEAFSVAMLYIMVAVHIDNGKSKIRRMS